MSKSFRPEILVAPPGAVPPAPVTAVVDRFTPLGTDDRGALASAPEGEAAHRALFGRFACLGEIERVGEARGRGDPAGPLRVLAWNVERLKYGAATAALVAWARPDLLLLSEIDIGMARSGNRHTVRDLAAATDMAGFDGVEFVEGGLGDSRERAWHAGERNLDGLHGNAILSPHPLRDPVLIRFDDHGAWFGAGGDRRVGGRMALAARATLRGGPMVAVSVHLESHTSPEDRARQLGHLLAAVEALAPGAPAIVGGDVNSHLFDLGDTHGDEDKARLVAAHGSLVFPERIEPMFALAARTGWAFAAANVEGAATQRTRPGGTPRPPFGKLDWFFTRGLVASDPVVIPAVDSRGRTISDHEAIAVTIDLPGFAPVPDLLR
jgi:endonuclease/exonuclease/phosphatase family metal-dependent hydrolase